MDELTRFQTRFRIGLPFHQYANLWLFVILSLNFWAAPLLPQDIASDVFTDGLVAFSLLAVIVFQGVAQPPFRNSALIVGIVLMGAVGVEEVWPDTKYLENGAFAVCFAAVTLFYFNTMIHSLDEVTLDNVGAAACTYMLIGMFFACIFSLVVEFDQASFSPRTSTSTFFGLLYYSFATLTTLGAADILPTTELTKLLTVFEAMIGLIYVAILVGAVVGSFSAKFARN